MSNSPNEELLQLARNRLIPYARLMLGEEYVLNRFHNYVATILEKAIVRTPGYTRICLSVPPQHGKSTLATQLFPSWAFGYSALQGIRTREYITCVSYAASLASEFGVEVRRLLSHKKYAAIFPELSLYGDNRTGGASIWLPNRGRFRAVGFDGALTGYPTSMMLVDDVTKNRQQAESPTYIKKLHSAFGPNMYTRLQSDALLINTQTRWNDQDLTGFLLDKYKSDNWLYIRLPALCDDELDPLERAIGEPLCPHRFTREDLLNTKRSMNIRDWSALYQNDPIAGSGSFWKPEYYRSAVEPAYWEFELIFCSWDCANEQHTAADYTACTLWGIKDGKLWELGCWRWQVDFVGLCEVFHEVHNKFTPALHVIEKAQNGIALANWMASNENIAVETYPAQTRKGPEFAFMAKELKDGNVIFAEATRPEGDCKAEKLQELSQWPSTKNDDLALSHLIGVRWFQLNRTMFAKYVGLQQKQKEARRDLQLVRRKAKPKFGSVTGLGGYGLA